MNHDASATEAPRAGAGPLAGRTIVLGVTGSIAAYKAAEIVRLLVKAGADVHVVCTPHALEFVAPLTFQVLSGHRVTTSSFDEPEVAPAAASDERTVSPVEHIDLATRADLVLVAPATANILGKLAHGIADDALSTLLLAVRCPVVIAPAMNTAMYEHPAVAANREMLAARGCIFVEPDAGELACRTVGIGRLAAPEAIVDVVTGTLAPRPLAGRTILVTAGRTEEPLDPVRILTNRSSGKMGFALAAAARDRGARVIVVAGATSVAPPSGVDVRTVRTAAEMESAVTDAAREADAVIMAAAVSDYRAASPSATKIERSADGLALALEPTHDILAGLGQRKGGRVLVGFALETVNEGADLDRAREKMRRKNCDLMVLNNTTTPGAEIGGDTNVVTLLSSGGAVERLPQLPKASVAAHILDRVEALFTQRNGGRGRSA